MSGEKELIVCPNVEDIVLKLGGIIDGACKRNKKEVMTIAVSGASLVSMLGKAMAQVSPSDVKKIKFILVDERLVTSSSEDSTYGSYIKLNQPNLFNGDNFVKVNESLMNKPEECARDYEDQLRVIFGCDLPSIDLTLLGFGPDGHTASLFPGHPLLEEKDKWVASITDSPKPPPNRITLTFPVINNSKAIVVVGAGASKVDIIKQVFEQDDPLPINMVFCLGKRVTWLVDTDAAGSVKGN